MTRERELAKIEAEAGYITYPEESPGKQLTFRENVHQAIEAAYKLGERLGREEEREEIEMRVRKFLHHSHPGLFQCASDLKCEVCELCAVIRARGVAQNAADAPNLDVTPGGKGECCSCHKPTSYICPFCKIKSGKLFWLCSEVKCREAHEDRGECHRTGYVRQS